MTSTEELLLTAADNLGISRNNNESDTAWKLRVVYSAIGRQSYASLWDSNTTDSDVSITHFKRKVKSLLLAWKDILPEIANEFTVDENEFADEVYEIFENTGSIWHSPMRVSPSEERIIHRGQLQLLRSSKLNRNVLFTGLGAYAIDNNCDEFDDYSSFGIDKHTLEEIYTHETSICEFRKFEGQDDTQYLRLSPPFSKGYWQNYPDEGETISLMRTNNNDNNRTYYLYRYIGDHLVVYQIPKWKTESHMCRNISVPILHNKGSLPAIEYSSSDKLVTVKLQYLLPPAELNFLILYSWPSTYRISRSYFKRTMIKCVFEDFRSVLEKKGYRFIKG